MPKVKFKARTTDEIESLDIENGSVIYNTENGKTYLDYNDERIPTGGGAGGGVAIGDTPPENPEENDLWVDTNDEEHLAEVDDEVSTTSTNAVQNQAITNYVNSLNTYSTSETVCGTWDGKPLYRKFFSGTSSSTTTTTINAGLSNVDNVVKVGGTIKSTSGIYMNAGGYLNNDNYCFIYYSKSANNIVYTIPTAYASGTYYITVEYTKTTD